MAHSRPMIRMSIVVFLSVGCIAQAQSRLMRFADVHQDRVVFAYERDLWLVSSTGGQARRITNDPGSETWAKFSPDGSMIAFTGQYDGGTDVYVVAADGGVPRRLTYHPARDRALGWWPGGKEVLFRSSREYPSRGEEVYCVSIEGGLPVKLPIDRAGLLSVSADGTKVAYNRISREARTWKRHQGGTAQEIWMGSLEAGDFHKITDWVGSDNFPMWVGDAIYFNSDRKFGTLNIYKYDVANGQVSALTSYKDYDVKNPSAGLGQIVYQYGEALHLLDLKSGKSQVIDIQIASDLVRMRPELVEVAPSIGAFGLSPSGKRMLLDARGEVLNIPVEEGQPINLTRTTNSREKNAAWSPDGKWVLFISDKSGEEELYLVDQRGEQPWKQLTQGGQGYRMQPVWSPDSKHIIFSDKSMRLNLVGVDGGDVQVLDRSDYDDGWYRWGIQDYVWSPDSRWIAYSKMEQSINEAIFLYSMEQGKTHRVTDEVYTDFSPSFSPDGLYLYFLSNRTFNPIMGAVEQNYVFLNMCRPYMALLQNDAVSPFALQDEEESVSQEASEDEGSENQEEESKNRIDLAGLERRILAVEGVSPGQYFRLEATDDGFLYLAKEEQQFQKYQNINDETSDRVDLHAYNLEDSESKKITSGINNYHRSADGKKLVYRAGSSYGVVNSGSKSSVGDGNISLSGIRISVDRNEEFNQIFDEAWRVQRDWFYDVNMHGVDWPAMREKYRKLIPHCGNRSDLNYVIGEMIAELNVGHTYIFGGDFQGGAKRVSVGLLGVDFHLDAAAGYYQLAHVIPGTPWKGSERSPIGMPGCPIKEGDYLIAIDGQEVTTGDNPFGYLQNKANKLVTLTYNNKPSAEGSKTYRIKTLRSERTIRYREWVDNNRAKVAKASGGQIGYLHIPDMMDPGLKEFAPYYFSQHYKKGFIIDERYNGGGFTSNMLIDRFERKTWAMTKPREGNPTHEPERSFRGHLAVLVNEDTGSSGEWFAEGIKRKRIAPLIGMRTWGGAVGIELHQPLVDGGGTTPPQFAPYGLDRTWIVEGHGVDPDMEVQNMPVDVLDGKDAQLEAAIKYLMDRIKAEPMETPAPPPYEDKSKKSAS